MRQKKMSMESKAPQAEQHKEMHPTCGKRHAALFTDEEIFSLFTHAHLCDKQ
jgi:hypothetical protein